uniref:Uncharacterized protein n=1 Tax=Corethron hystrix TaxID=216773 RepID=A0A7S1BGR0_9STRA
MRTFLLLLTSLAAASAFSPVGTPSRSRPIRHALRMRFFDALFAPKSASASHILITGPRASEQCEKLKMDIYRKAIGGGDPRAGVSAPALMEAVSPSEGPPARTELCV